MKNTAITSETKSYYSTNTSYLTEYNFDGERSNPHSPWTAAQITILEIHGCQTSGICRWQNRLSAHFTWNVP
jgi:hypothetical protein